MGPLRSTTLQRLVKSAADTSILRRNSASKPSFLLLPSANSCAGCISAAIGDAKDGAETLICAAQSAGTAPTKVFSSAIVRTRRGGRRHTALTRGASLWELLLLPNSAVAQTMSPPHRDRDSARRGMRGDGEGHMQVHTDTAPLEVTPLPHSISVPALWKMAEIERVYIQAIRAVSSGREGAKSYKKSESDRFARSQYFRAE